MGVGEQFQLQFPVPPIGVVRVSAPNPSDQGAARRLLLCRTCGQMGLISATAALEFTRTGWPKCCGEVLSYVVGATDPTPAPERPNAAETGLGSRTVS